VSDGTSGRGRSRLRDRVLRRLLLPVHGDDRRVFAWRRGGRWHRGALRLLGASVSVRVRWRGHVRGVGLEAWLERRAARYGVHATLLERPDDAVEAILSGSPRQVERVLQRAWQGSRGADVRSIRLRPGAPAAARTGPVGDDVALATERAFERALAVLDDRLERPNAYGERAVKGRLGIYRRAASGLGIAFGRYGGPTVGVYELRRGGDVDAFASGMSARVTPSARLLANDKHLTKAWLTAHGLPVARGGVVSDVDEGLAWFAALDGDVVVKPVEGDSGRGISVGVRSREAFRAAFAEATRVHPRVLVEETVRASDLRVVTIDGVARAAVLRVPAHVVGDGRSSVATLVARKNRQRRLNPHLARRPIRIDANARRVLGGAGLTPRSVPAAGRRVYLTYTANLSAGGDSVGVLDALHPEVTALAEHVARSLGPGLHLGVDVLLEHLDRPPAEQRCVVCEVNANPAPTVARYPAYGPAFDTPRAVLEAVFGADASPRPERSVVDLDVRGPEGAEALLGWLHTWVGSRVEVAVDRVGTVLRVRCVGPDEILDAMSELVWRYPAPLGEDVVGVVRRSAPPRPVARGVPSTLWPLPAPAGAPVDLAALGVALGAVDAPASQPIAAAFERRAWRARACRGGRWLVSDERGAVGVCGAMHASIAARRMARLRYPLYRRLSDAGIEVRPHALVPLSEPDRAASLVERHGGAWRTAAVVGRSALPLARGDGRDLAWLRASWPTRARAVLLEADPEGEVEAEVEGVLVVAGRAEPVSPAASVAPPVLRCAERAVATLPGVEAAVVWLGRAATGGPCTVLEVDLDLDVAALDAHAAGAAAHAGQRLVDELLLGGRAFWFRTAT